MHHFIQIPSTRFAFSYQKKLGEGYGGEIFQGFNTFNSQTIAVKILNSNSRLENQITCQEMKQIAKNNNYQSKNSKLDQNQLVEILDIIQLDKTYIIMQLCKCNLKQYVLQKSSITENQLFKILKNIVEALIKIQQHGFHCCDLKPENILITKRNEAKLGDLDSLIRLKDLGGNKRQKFRQQIFGTLHYMPPELIQFGEYGPQNYIWALGIMLHEIIYNKTPFNVNTKTQNNQKRDRQIIAAEFYKNLLNLNVCTYESKSYPKSHQLMKNMLRLNYKKRIQLQKLHEFISSITKNQQKLAEQTMKLINGNQNSQQYFGKISQATSDNSFNQDISDFEGLDTEKQVEQIVIKFNEQIDQNQKQQPIKLIVSEPLINQQKQQSENQQKQEFYNQFFFSTFTLIDQIHSPLILVKKLNDLKTGLNNILSSQNTKPQTSQCKMMKQKCLKLIKESKAYSHLQKTYKYSTSEKDKQLNFRELTLFQHLNQLFNQLNQNSYQLISQNV